MVSALGSINSAGAGSKRMRSQELVGVALPEAAAGGPESASQASLVDIADEHGEIDFSRYPAGHRILLASFSKKLQTAEGFTIGKPKEHFFVEEKVKITSYTLVKGFDAAGSPIVERYGYVVERQKEDSRWVSLLICYAEPYQELVPKIPHTQESLEPYVHDETSSYEAARSVFRAYRINWRLYNRLRGGHIRWQRYSPVEADRRNIHSILKGKFGLSQRIADYMTSLN